ncbi:MAG: hypothetical protein LBC79_01460, partial [Deltaproteobacteria bacterium]|nr:hypothetical protein [Deltaproteobacteria bacterium]
MSGRTIRAAALAVLLAVLVISSAWEMHALRHEGEFRLRRDTVTLVKRAGLHFARICWERDAPAARGSIFVEMEDLRLAGMVIHDREGLLEGMRRNGLWESVPWDDLLPENSVEAAAPVMMEDVQVGEVIVYLSRRALDEEISARARREFARVAALAVIPCIALALLLREFAARRAEQQTQTASPMPPQPLSPVQRQNDKRRAGGEAVPTTPLRLPQDWNSEDARRAYLEACRAFLRDRHASAALLYRLAAREEWGELREAARSLR